MRGTRRYDERYPVNIKANLIDLDLRCFYKWKGKYLYEVAEDENYLSERNTLKYLHNLDLEKTAFELCTGHFNKQVLYMGKFRDPDYVIKKVQQRRSRRSGETLTQYVNVLLAHTQKVLLFQGYAELSTRDVFKRFSDLMYQMAGEKYNYTWYSSKFWNERIENQMISTWAFDNNKFVEYMRDKFANAANSHFGYAAFKYLRRRLITHAGTRPFTGRCNMELECKFDFNNPPKKIDTSFIDKEEGLMPIYKHYHDVQCSYMADSRNARFISDHYIIDAEGKFFFRQGC